MGNNWNPADPHVNYYVLEYTLNGKDWIQYNNGAQIFSHSHQNYGQIQAVIVQPFVALAVRFYPTRSIVGHQAGLKVEVYYEQEFNQNEFNPAFFHPAWN